MSRLTLSKHPFASHYPPPTTPSGLRYIWQEELHRLSCSSITEIFPLSLKVIMVGAENFKRRVNFGLIKMTALSFGNPFGFITIVCRIYRQGSRMATQKMLQPQPSNRENERRWGGVSRCCSVFGVTLTQFPPLGLRLNTTAVHRRSKRKNKERNKPPEKNLSSVQIVSQTSCLFVTKSTRRFAEIHCLRS